MKKLKERHNKKLNFAKYIDSDNPNLEMMQYEIERDHPKAAFDAYVRMLRDGTISLKEFKENTERVLNNAVKNMKFELFGIGIKEDDKNE